MRIPRENGPAGLVVLALLAGCGDSPGAEPSDPDASSSPSADASPEPPPADPFAPMPDRDGDLTNVSADLEALLEHGALEGACDAWRADREDRRKMLLCGKSMFFYESFGTLGIPRPLIEFLLESFPDQVGPAFQQYGMIPDPTSEAGLPLGLAPGAPFGDVESLAFTCAGCHFGQLPDGRYAVGAANHQYDYGGHMLAVLLFPQLAIPGADPADHDPSAVARVQPLLDVYNDSTALQLEFFAKMAPLLTDGGGGGMPSLTPEQERQYASWKLGTMDFTMAPLPLDDQVHTVSKIISLFGLPNQEEIQEAGMDHAMLSWAGNARSTMEFVEGFVVIGEGEATWTEEELRPLVAYVESLAPPAPEPMPEADAVARGEEVFFDAGCADCHGGPRGSGTTLYEFDEIGTDDAMAAWMDPDLDGEPCCGVEMEHPLSHQIKSPRLVGLWAMERFLHNGSVESLEDLLCEGGSRPTVTEEPYGDGGHLYGCDLPAPDKSDLAAFLRAH